MWNFLGSLASGVMGLFGGSKSNDAQLQANAQNVAAQERINAENRAAAEANAIRNIEFQKEFAKSGLQWKAEDARAAGIHPIYAMGASGASFAPVSIAGGEGQAPRVQAATGMGEAISRAGQSFGRAIQAANPREQQMEAISQSAAQLQLTNAGLQNELLAAQVMKAKQELIAKPAMPSLGQRWLMPGQGDTQGSSGLSFEDRWSPIKITEKNERVSADPRAPHREAFSVSDLGHSRTAGGGYSAIPSKDVQERIEDNWLQQVVWLLRNNLLPSIGVNESPPPKELLPKGYDAWRYHPFYQEYRPHKRGWFGMHY